MKQAILITGAFDLLHDGHLFLLKTAKALAKACGGFVVCMVNSDEMVRTSKGPDRPIQNHHLRLSNLETLNFWDKDDHGFVFGHESEIEWFCKCHEPIRLIGSDYIDQSITGAEYCKAVLFIKRTNDSTTKSIADR